MKFDIERNLLFKSLSRAQSIVQSKTTIPILQNILISADSERGTIKIRTTDLDIEFMEELQVTIIQAGELTVGASLLFDIARKLPDGSLINFEFKSANNRLEVLSGRTDFTLATLPKEDFPKAISTEYDTAFSIEPQVLRPLFEKSKFAMSTEETRYYLNGVYMHIAKGDQGNVLRCVATDGHRLALVDSEAPDNSLDMPHVIIPRKAVTELGKLLSDINTEIKVSVSKSFVRFSADHLSLTARVVEGTFPDYNNVIPDSNKRRMEVNSKEFATAVDLVATVCEDTSKAITLNIGADKLGLSMRSPDSDTGEEELGVAYNAEDLSIGFNARYLFDIASQVDQKNIVFYFNTPDEPALIREGDNPNMLYVVMPMRV
ncbi:MAG: DNA polymerase III subunit beta [Aestuariivita sp.]|nr:DNA polymerase III subunit beta [Aestuariivita sp.]